MKTIDLLSHEAEMITSTEAASIMGGERCGCACRYRYAGGSSVADNSAANVANDLVSVGYRIEDCEEITIDGEVW